MKAEVIPVILGATGTVSKSLRQYLSNIPGKHDVRKLQKAAILGDTAPILWEVVMYTAYVTCEITLHVAQIVSTEQLQHCIP